MLREGLQRRMIRIRKTLTRLAVLVRLDALTPTGRAPCGYSPLPTHHSRRTRASLRLADAELITKST